MKTRYYGYFSNDPDGMQFHDSADAARHAAELTLETHRCEAEEDGWSDAVTDICWGEVRQRVAQIPTRAEDGVDYAFTPDLADKALKMSFEERAEALLSRVYGGMHHVHGLKKERLRWQCLHSGGLGSFDFDHLTNLVLGAHEYCIRVYVDNGGPRQLKVVLHDRQREGDFSQRHPNLEEAVKRWDKR